MLKKLSVKKNDLLFYIPYGIFLFFSALSTSFYYKYFIGPMYTIIILLTICVTLLREVSFEKLTMKTFLGYILFVGLFMLVIIFGEISIAAMFVFIICARNIKFDSIAKYSLGVLALAFGFIILSSKLGIIENYLYQDMVRVREYLGFRYALFGAALAFNISALYLYINRKKMKWKYILITFLFNLWLYIKMETRLSFFLICILLLLFGILKIQPRFLDKKKISRYGLALSYIICCVFSFCLIIMYSDKKIWINMLDEALGKRLSMGQTSLLEFGIGFWGTKTQWIGMGLDVYGERTPGNYLYVDNFYLNCAQKYGIFFLLLLICVLTILCFKVNKKKDYHFLIIMFCFAIHGLIDDQILTLYYDTFLLKCGMELFGDIKNKLVFMK